MNEKDVRFFLEIANNKENFSKAAKSLNISLSALSKHIKKLSDESGVQLFEPAKRSAIKLTPGGEILYKFFLEYRDKLSKTNISDLQIKYFLGIVNNSSSFTRASKALYVSQPALSKQIHLLEKELEVKLFDTTVKSSIKLTLEGERYYRFFTEYTEGLIKALKKARQANKQLSGEIKIAFPLGYDLSVLWQKINSFQSKYPHVIVSLVSAEFKAIETGIKNNNFDMLITQSFHLTSLETLENICKKEIYTIPLMLLYSLKHKLAGKENLTITDFADDILYTVSEEDTPRAKIMSELYCKSKGFIPTIKTLPNHESVLLTLERGSGFSIVGNWERTKVHPSYKHIELDINDTVCAVWKKDNHNTALEPFLKEL